VTSVPGDVADRRLERVASQRLCALGADDLAAKAEAAVDRADVGQLHQHAIAIAMHDVGHGREFGLAERIVPLPRLAHELARIGHELTRDRVARFAAFDEAGKLRGNGEGIAPRHRL
jgi:hypothetical protein